MKQGALGAYINMSQAQTQGTIEFCRPKSPEKSFRAFAFCMSWVVMADHLGWGIIEEEGWRKGPWTAEEDSLLVDYVRLHGEGRWNSVANIVGLKRNGKSCRLRWVNYLRPDLKRGQITPHEESIILELHARWGNRWSAIARSLPGRTDNEIKNYWRTHFKKKAKVPSDASRKAKTRLLRRQQFHHQQEQQQQQQQQCQQIQQQQLQLNQVDMERIMALLDENEHRATSQPQVKNEMVTIYPNTTEEQNYFSSLLHSNLPVPEASNEDIIWDGLWMDDVHGNFNIAASATGRASLHNLVTPFC